MFIRTPFLIEVDANNRPTVDGHNRMQSFIKHYEATREQFALRNAGIPLTEAERQRATDTD